MRKKKKLCCSGLKNNSPKTHNLVSMDYLNDKKLKFLSIMFKNWRSSTEEKQWILVGEKFKYQISWSKQLSGTIKNFTTEMNQTI